MTSEAYLSKGVFYKLTITKFFFLFPTKAGISAAGVTLNEDPIAKHKSAFSAYSNPSLISLSGKFSPKLMILSIKSPLHFGSSHFLPVL
jgi:hypothetical protein